MIIFRSGQHNPKAQGHLNWFVLSGEGLSSIFTESSQSVCRYLDLEAKMCTRQFLSLGKLINSKEKTY